MVSVDSGSGPEPVDPEFARLFRDEPSPRPAADDPERPAALPADAPAGTPAFADDDPLGYSEDPKPVDAPDLPESDLPVPPEPSTPNADTGRLFRSQGVHGNDTALLALSSDHFGRLRTLQRIDAEPPPPSDAAVAALQGGPVNPDGTKAAATSRAQARRAAAGLSAGITYLLIIGVTVVVAFINALLSSGDIGWPTGVALLLVTVFCALTIRRADDIVAVITPPLAFFLAAVTAAQVFLGTAERSLLNRAVVAFFTLADNWVWIIGSTLVALVIILVRRRRS